MQSFGKLKDRIMKNFSTRVDLKLEHRQNLNPTKKEIKEKPVRASDVPLFTQKDTEKLGLAIKKTYNNCINLAAYRPTIAPLIEGDLEERLKELEGFAIYQMKHLKKQKKKYSAIWKEHFKEYEHELIIPKKPVEGTDPPPLDRKISYDDSDPFDSMWMHHGALENSQEMQVAAEKYFQEASDVLENLKQIFKDIKKALKDISRAHNVSLRTWAKGGMEQAKDRLVLIQKQVDEILASEWEKIKKNFKGKFKGITPSYIGSTHTGQKSITKAYIQFNPNDYDVDGQLISTELYVAISHFVQSASKGRFFVREVADKVINPVGLFIKEKKTAQGEKLKSAALTELKILKNIMLALENYVDKVQARLLELDGVEYDKDDLFDLAIVRADGVKLDSMEKEIVQKIKEKEANPLDAEE